MFKVRDNVTKEMLEVLNFSLLREIASAIGVQGPTSKTKNELIPLIMDMKEGRIKPYVSTKGAPKKEKNIDISMYVFEDNGLNNRKIVFGDRVSRKKGAFESEGLFEQTSSNYGFLRKVPNQINQEEDVFLTNQLIKDYNIRTGDLVKVKAEFRNDNDASARAIEILTINGKKAGLCEKRARFDEFIACHPNQRITLEGNDDNADVSIRVIDLFAPIGKGQRALIVAPPKTGKTTLIKNIACAIEKNHPDITVMILLIDERPEEVTDIKSAVKSNVYASTFDESPEEHIKVSEFVIERAKRLVEEGGDVVILMDSITRLVRASNNIVVPSGRTLSGGLDPLAMQFSKQFFGSARNVPNGGSLTIISTALIDTGSRMDDVVYEELKGTGNMEVHLSRDLAERRVFPAIDLFKSGTRKEDYLLSKQELDVIYALRRTLSGQHDATDRVLEVMYKTKNNADFLVKSSAFVKYESK